MSYKLVPSWAIITGSQILPGISATLEALTAETFSISLITDNVNAYGDLEFNLLQNNAQSIWSGKAASTGTWTHTLTAAEESSNYKLSIYQKSSIFDQPIARHIHGKQHEITDHLGNVRAVVGSGLESGGGSSIYPRVIATNSYYPFGMLIDALSTNSEGYRYGFNGMELDNEVKGVGNSLDYGARIYDSRLGRWLSLDPSQSRYPHLSPYNSFENNPVYFNDPDGKDARITIDAKNKTISVSTIIYIYGSGATAEKAAEMQGNIMNTWGQEGLTYSDSETGDVYNVKFSVGVRVYGNKNTNHIPGVFDPFDTNNYVEVKNQEGRSYVHGRGHKAPKMRGTGLYRDFKTGIFFTTRNRRPVDDSFHEIGHLFGLSDRYNSLVDENGKDLGLPSLVHDGYENNVMGGLGSEITQEQIDAIVGNAVKVYNNNWKAIWNNSKMVPGYSEFEYHLNQKDREENHDKAVPVESESNL